MIELLRHPLDGDAVLQKKRALKKQLLENGEFIEKKVAVLSGSTIGEFKNILEIFLLAYGIRPVFFEGQYGRFFEDAVFGSPELDDFAPDIVYFHTSNKNITEFPATGSDNEKKQEMLNEAFSVFEKAWKSIQEHYGCAIIQNNFDALDYRIMGNLDSVHPSGRNCFINSLNHMLYEYQNNNDGFYINDINYLAALYGLDKWSDRTSWYMYKYLCAPSAIPLVCDSIAKIIKALYGRNKKSLMIDLDNTLWGGVIGDDGVSGLKLGKESPEGMAFADFQDYIKELGRMGISLNVCSKNQEDTAKEGFSHPSSILKEEDFIYFKANWEPKSQNISETAKDLNIGMDSVVFIDDNPAERQIVTGFLPDVSAPELSSPEDYVRTLDRCGYFETVHLGNDDLSRNNAYRDNLERKKQLASFSDYGEYLCSLDMKCYLSHFSKRNIERATQLINKTNQFNFTTLRLSESEVAAWADDSDRISYCARLEDKFGDNGITGIISAKIRGENADIDLFLMSCRVFKRELEYVMLESLMHALKKRGVKTLRGRYIPTKKNIIIKDFYAEYGFLQTAEEGIFETDITAFEAKKYAMEIIYDD